MALRIRIIAVGYREQVSLKQFQGTIYIILPQGKAHLGSCRQTTACLRGGIHGQQAFHQSDAHLPVRDVQRIEFRLRIILLDGDIPALIE